MKKQAALAASFAVYLLMNLPPAYAAIGGKCEAEFGKFIGYKAVAPPLPVKPKDRTITERIPAQPGQNSTVPTELLESVQLEGISESPYVKRVSVALEGQFKPALIAETNLGPRYAPGGQPTIYNGREYFEFPNSTYDSAIGANGKKRFWMYTRGVRKYETGIDRKDGEISPNGYVSDVLLYEMIDGKPHFHSVFLESSPENKFLFEDPRISVIPDGRGGEIHFLSGTDYSPHIPQADNPHNNPDVMNRYIEVKYDKNGVPQPVEVDPITKRPQFRDLSPAPQKRADGKYTEVDAKNATVSMNERGEIVVLPRLRPNFSNDRSMRELFDGDSWTYAEQVFIFKNWNEFKNYNWADAMADLAGKGDQAKRHGAVKPVYVRELIRDTDLKEHLTVNPNDTHVSIVKGEKGLGPGTRPVRIRRAGDLLLVSDGPGLPERVHAVLNESERASYPLAEGQVTFGKLDHEIRKYKQNVRSGTLKRRHYTGTAKFLNDRMTEITAYRPDAIQPKNAHEKGLNSGILDLQHQYPMGIVIGDATPISKKTLDYLKELREAASKDPAAKAKYESSLKYVADKLGLAKIQVTSGTSDAHTMILEVDFKGLYKEAVDMTKAESAK